MLDMSCCGWVWVKPCGSYRCKPCAGKARRRKARVVGTGMHVQDLAGRRLWLLTLTAPGERAHQRWTPVQAYRRGAARPDCDCHEGFDLAVWNPAAGSCWNRLRTSLSREVEVEYYRATEVQEGHRGGSGRGALHHHVVIAAAGQLDVMAVQQLALAAGYGCVIDLRPITTEQGFSEVARYISKTLAGYVTKSAGDGRSNVPWKRQVVDEDTGEVRLLHTVPTYRLSSQSAGWGCTESEVRSIAQAQARKRAAALAQRQYTGPIEWDPTGEPIDWAEPAPPL